MTSLMPLMAGLATSLALSAGAESETTDAQTRLDRIVAGGGEATLAVPGAAVAIWLDGDIILSIASGAALFEDDGVTLARALSANSPVRAASISKLVTALTALELHRAGVIDLDAPIEPLLGFELPIDHAGQVTIRSALAHTSGICDPDAYWAPLGAEMAGLIGPEIACDHDPGGGWAYANINYGLVAQALETASGERFDHLATRLVLEPLGLDAGFNWSGVSAEKRAGGAALHRPGETGWAVQIDEAHTLLGDAPALRALPGAELSAYEPGRNGTLFSPQGGLRAGAEDLARLAAAFLPGGMGADLTAPVWTGEEEPGVQAWASGPQILVAGQIESHRDLTLIGHAGEAYGLYGGAWALPDRNAALAFYVTGSDPAGLGRDPRSGFTFWEARLLTLALDELDRHASRSDAP